MRFLIDCDNVMAQWTSMFLRVCKEQFNIYPNITSDKNWDIFNYPDVLTKKDEIWTYILSTPGLIYGLEKYPYTDDLLYNLRKRGEVICCTSIVVNTVDFGKITEHTDKGYYADERIRWLIDKAGFSRYDIVLGYKKYTIEGDALIDDKPDNVIKWADRWYKPNITVPVLWQPPEKPIKIDDKRIFSCGNVNDLMNHFDNLKVSNGTN